MPDRVFWRLSAPEAISEYAERVRVDVLTEKIHCPLNPDHQRGGRRLTNLSVALPRYSVDDIVWTWTSECLIQNDVLSVLKREQFTGFDVNPVKVKFKNSSQALLPTLWELVRTGWGGLARPESGISRIEYCEGCKHAVYSSMQDARYLIDESQWDGSDFFMVWPLPKYVFVTQRVADCVRDHQWTGAILTPVHELKRSHSTIDGCSPGRLSHYLSDTRARVLGTMADIAEI